MSNKLKNPNQFAAQFEAAAHTDGEPANGYYHNITSYEIAQNKLNSLLDTFCAEYEKLIDLCGVRGLADYSDYKNFIAELRVSIKNVLDDAHLMSNTCKQ